MALIDSVVLIGHLTKDCELKHFNNGNAIVKGSIAQNRKKKQGDEWVDEAQFFDFAYGGKGAEGIHKYLTKGKQIGIQGELRQDRWEQEGQARSKVFVSAFEIQLLGGERQTTGSQSPQNGHQEAAVYNPQEQYHQNPEAVQEQFEDDIPF